MSQKNRSQLEVDYNSTTSGNFPNNTSQAIKSANMRAMSKDYSDSHFNLISDKYSGASGLKPGLNTITELKAIFTTSLSVGTVSLFRDTGNGNVLRVYELVSGTDAEVSPDVIRPSDYAASTNEKVWKLLVSFSYESFTVTASGTDTYTATLVPAIVAYAANQKVFIKFTNANTGAATINLNGLGAKSIKKSGGTDLAAGDISANQILCLVYDGTNFQVVGGGGGGTSLTDPLVFKGAIDCSANPNYPAADAGDVYKVSVAGKIGGGSGPNVEVGDTLLCTVDASPSGNHATVGANWVILQTNIDPALYAPLASPTFTGTPAAPTAAPGTSTTQIASTEFVTKNNVPTVITTSGSLTINGVSGSLLTLDCANKEESKFKFVGDTTPLSIAIDNFPEGAYCLLTIERTTNTNLSLRFKNKTYLLSNTQLIDNGKDALIVRGRSSGRTVALLGIYSAGEVGAQNNESSPVTTNLCNQLKFLEDTEL